MVLVAEEGEIHCEEVPALWEGFGMEHRIGLL